MTSAILQLSEWRAGDLGKDVLSLLQFNILNLFLGLFGRSAFVDSFLHLSNRRSIYLKYFLLCELILFLSIFRIL